jgi:hypothetical protein
MTDWAAVAQTLGAAAIGAASTAAGAFLTYKAAQDRLRQERAKAQEELWRKAYTDLLTTARQFDPREIRQSEIFRRWEDSFHQQLNGVMFAPAAVRAAAQQLRGSYREEKTRLVTALAKGENQFDAAAITVSNNWGGIVNVFEDAAADDLNKGG